MNTPLNAAAYSKIADKAMIKGAEQILGKLGLAQMTNG